MAPLPPLIHPTALRNPYVTTVTDGAGEATNGGAVMLVRPFPDRVEVIANSATPTEGFVTAYAVCSR